MAKVLQDTKIYYKGNSQVIPAGTVYPDDAEIVKLNKELFVFEDKPKKEVKKTQPKKKPKKEELKEELLVEAPVAELKVEIKEEAKDLK